MTWARVGIGRYKVLWKSNIAIVTKIVERRISETPGNQVLGEGEIHLATFPHWEGTKVVTLIERGYVFRKTKESV